jgi:hypothetical protein
MSSLTWMLAFYLLAITAACFYSVYLMDKSKGLFDKDLMFVGRSPEGASGAQQEGLMLNTRAAVTYYKYLTYALITGNAFIIIAMFLLDFKVFFRDGVLPAVGGRRR